MTDLLRALVLAPALLTVSAPAFAQEDDSDYSELDEGDEKSRKSRKAREAREEVIREIERGTYAKANIGSTTYLLNYSAGVLRSGTSLALGIGSEFIDQERNSAAWEIALMQGVHNGLHYERTADCIQQGACPPAAAIQGDTRTFSALAGVEYSVYPTRRIGVGARLGGGVMFSPLLMNRQAFERDVLDEFGGEIAPYLLAAHDSPHPLVYVGPTFEYYTKLSHFSVGADVDAAYVIGFDLGVTGTGYFKYTF